MTRACHMPFCHHPLLVFIGPAVPVQAGNVQCPCCAPYSCIKAKRAHAEWPPTAQAPPSTDGPRSVLRRPLRSLRSVVSEPARPTDAVTVPMLLPKRLALPALWMVVSRRCRSRIDGACARAHAPHHTSARVRCLDRQPGELWEHESKKKFLPTGGARSSLPIAPHRLPEGPDVPP